jgi:hypothetical protein
MATAMTSQTIGNVDLMAVTVVDPVLTRNTVLIAYAEMGLIWE